MTSEVTEPRQASCMTVLFMKSPTTCSFWISLFLLLILIQMLISLLLPHIISFTVFAFETYTELIHAKHNQIVLVGVLGVCVPLVLVAFALLAMLFAAYGKDRAVLRLSMVCQATSSLLTLVGIVSFLIIDRLYVTRQNITPWFYNYVCVEVELIITTVMTYVSGRRLPPDWR